MNGKLKVGETVWVTSRWRKDDRPETVVKVGRQYAYTSGHRKIDLKKFESEGRAYDCNHEFFPSQAHYERHLQTVKAQIALMDRMKREYLTLEQIQAINELLGWKKP